MYAHFAWLENPRKNIFEKNKKFSIYNIRKKTWFEASKCIYFGILTLFFMKNSILLSLLILNNPLARFLFSLRKTNHFFPPTPLICIMLFSYRVAIRYLYIYTHILKDSRFFCQWYIHPYGVKFSYYFFSY